MIFALFIERKNTFGLNGISVFLCIPPSGGSNNMAILQFSKVSIKSAVYLLFFPTSLWLTIPLFGMLVMLIVTVSTLTISLCVSSALLLFLCSICDAFAACGGSVRRGKLRLALVWDAPGEYPRCCFPPDFSVEQQPHSFPRAIVKWQCSGRNDHKPKWQFDWIGLRR